MVKPNGKMRRRRLRDLSIVQNTPNSEEANSEQQTVIGSLNVPETLNKPAEFQTRNAIIARNANMLPINYESWHHMPDSNKNQTLDNIKDRERAGTSSRQKQKFTHTVGSRSFASVAEVEEVSSGQKVGRLQLFEITHRKKDGSSMTSKLEKLWFDFKDLVLPRPNVLDLAPSNTCLPGVKLKLKFRDVAAREVAAVAREAEAAAMAAEQSRKYDELQLQLQHMMQTFQQSQKQPF
ncbi:hypothetical protein GOBAR_AA00327 [Gossypium barbadense]|uniref:Uncharacterized protein n=1 Tax=Gossypium barbadense TaxID=3634 RepID=A0A2P5YXG5_GOSBA|nr:hypothetical protein GOBAR_AA00327 [Gossypium barbadense]